MHVRVSAGVFAALVVLLLSVPSLTFAQTPPPPPPRHQGSAELAFVGTSGNTATSTVSAGFEYLAQPTGWLVKNRVLAIQSRAAGETTAESLLYAFRLERRVDNHLSAFADYAYFRDEPAGISRRNSITVGLATTLVAKARHTVKADVGAGAIREIRVAGPDLSSATWSGGMAYALKISGTATFSDEVKILGLFDTAEDWRMTHALALSAKLNSMFSLKFANVVRYAHLPPPGFKRTDTTTTIALVATLTRR